MLEDLVREGEIPFVLAVEHVFAAAGMLWCLEKTGGKCTCLVLDAHVDLFELWERSAARGYIYKGPRTEGVSSGNFLKHVINTFPEIDVWVIGVSERMEKGSITARILDVYGKKGLKVVPAEEVMADPVSTLTTVLKNACYNVVYLSVDSDVSVRETTGAVRFADFEGLSRDTLFAVAAALGSAINKGQVHLGGVDLCEIFPPLTLVDEDKTVQMWAEFFKNISPELAFYR